MTTQLIANIQAHPLLQIGVLLFFVFLCASLMKVLRQPLMIGYILAGVIVGPLLGLIHDKEMIHLFGDLGIGLLLFIVGLGLKPSVLKELGFPIAVQGTIQVILTTLIGLGCVYLLGYDLSTSVYLGLAMAFSSTIMVVKVLTDRDVTSSLYGRYTIGILIIQDIMAIAVLIVLATLSSGGVWYASLLGGIGLFAVMLLIDYRILPRVLPIISSSGEYLLLFGLAWCFFRGGMMQIVGLNIEIGCLLAGIILANSDYAYELSIKLKPLRDFFVIEFFVLLGMQVARGFFDQRGVLLVMLAIVVLIKPLIIYAVQRLYNILPTTAYLTGLHLGQMSEFGLLIIGLGSQYGHITDPNLSAVVIIAAIMSMVINSYLVQLDSKTVGQFNSKAVRQGEDNDKFDGRDELASPHTQKDLVILGFGRMGSYILSALPREEYKILVIDHDPKVIEQLRMVKDVDFLYADVRHIDEMTEEVDRTQVRLVISTVYDYHINRKLITYLQKISPDTKTILISHHEQDTFNLYDHGSDYVVMPHNIAAKHIYDIVKQELNS